MDGVLVKYDIGAYSGDNPLWLRKNGHYFKDLEPDRKMLEFVDKLHQQCRYNDDEMFILTSLPMNSAMFNEHFHDKIIWLNKWIPYMEIDNILISVTSKRDAIEYIKDHQLTKNDILIDDYNKNLNEWQAGGGVAVKYINGINSPDSFDGIKIYKNEPVWTMFHRLNIG
jgi:5'(3')-deoxyribonucleotidase